MPTLQKNCQSCQNVFPIDERDQAYYQKMNVPAPKKCPDCRMQLRFYMRNEHNLYPDACDLCQKPMISVYSPDKNYPAYCNGCYWSDKWDVMQYGKEPDFTRPFLEQVQELFHTVPAPGLYRFGNNINSDYTHDVLNLKNCYLTFDGEEGEDCYYGETFVNIKDSAEFLDAVKNQLNYETVNCLNCYNVQYSSFSKDCSDSLFLMDCIGVKNSLGCINLHQKEYHIFNKPYSKEEYQQKLKEFQLHTYQGLQAFKQKFREFSLKQPHQATREIQSENCTGDNMVNCKDSFDSFDCVGMRDCRYCTNMKVPTSNDCYDVDIWGSNSSRAYNTVVTGVGCENIFFCYYVALQASDVYYSAFCTRNVTNLFGCVGLRQKSYCILNRQYSPQEYKTMVERIKKHMEETGEWGEFFPQSFSPFGYNETVANIYFPLTKEQAQKAGFAWYNSPDKPPQKPYTLPDSIQETQESVCQEILACQQCKKAYKIIPQELKILKKLNVPAPRKCFMCRHTDRFNVRNPRKIWTRTCQNCQKNVPSTYAPERPETVYCKECYLKEVY